MIPSKRHKHEGKARTTPHNNTILLYPLFLYVSGTAGAGGTNIFWSINAKVPIQGWNANFNPLLSMPLVEIGNDIDVSNPNLLILSYDTS